MMVAIGGCRKCCEYFDGLQRCGRKCCEYCVMQTLQECCHDFVEAPFSLQPDFVEAPFSLQPCQAAVGCAAIMLTVTGVHGDVRRTTCVTTARLGLRGATLAQRLHTDFRIMHMTSACWQFGFCVTRACSFVSAMRERARRNIIASIPIRKSVCRLKSQFAPWQDT